MTLIRTDFIYSFILLMFNQCNLESVYEIYNTIHYRVVHKKLPVWKTLQKIWLRIIEMGPWFINGCVRQWRIGKCWFQANWTWWRSNTVMSSEAPHFWRHRVMPFLEITTCKASPTFLSFLSLKVKCKGLLDPIWIRIIEDINIWECNGHFETKDRPYFAWKSEKIHWISGNFWITDKFTKISWKTTLFWLYRALLKFWYIKKMYFLCSFVIWYLMLESYCVIERKYEGYKKRGKKHRATGKKIMAFQHVCQIWQIYGLKREIRASSTDFYDAVYSKWV